MRTDSKVGGGWGRVTGQEQTPLEDFQQGVTGFDACPQTITLAVLG